ncbi:hypothetical protein RFI_26036 [Reticulomyxa filosa]|uniref:Uncharacterized protein n=1 Tax=Reticulomyxa filosa TaxID=46433 RepID=X6MBU9_RETFI|nr:hypothetical protein RFI_26036 [Reticulomyxa filosa]|eukprot:ETO11339.1 hypothetical protein RFI_26036 [Reticulomyxa filosa]
MCETTAGKNNSISIVCIFSNYFIDCILCEQISLQLLKDSIFIFFLFIYLMKMKTETSIVLYLQIFQIYLLQFNVLYSFLLGYYTNFSVSLSSINAISAENGGLLSLISACPIHKFSVSNIRSNEDVYVFTFSKKSENSDDTVVSLIVCQKFRKLRQYSGKLSGRTEQLVRYTRLCGMEKYVPLTNIQNCFFELFSQMITFIGKNDLSKINRIS